MSMYGRIISTNRCLRMANQLFDIEAAEPRSVDMITQLPKISAIYYGLLQSGYDFYTFERSNEHIKELKALCKPERSSAFFSETKQNTCDVYPYWPRAFIMEAASSFLNHGNTGFQDFGIFRRKIMSMGNLTEKERDDSLWTWLADFPQALASVLSEDPFSEYLDWEKKWIAEQDGIHYEETHIILKCLEICATRYHSPVQRIQICINPIKCVYASDYHLMGNCFIFSSGAFRADSVIHELLHCAVHPYVGQKTSSILEHRPFNSQIDKSYYLSGSDSGLINAFEETVVRSLTEEIMNGKYPEDLSTYMDTILTHK